MAATVSASPAVAVATIGNWAKTEGPVVVSAQVATTIAGHLRRVVSQDSAKRAERNHQDSALAADDEGDGSETGGSVATAAVDGSVSAVAEAVNTAIRRVREDAQSTLVGLETRLQLAASLAADIAGTTAHAAPGSVAQHLDRALVRIAEVRRSCDSGAELADTWVKGL